jgi:hypothetical protein
MSKLRFLTVSPFIAVLLQLQLKHFPSFVQVLPYSRIAELASGRTPEKCVPLFETFFFWSFHGRKEGKKDMMDSEGTGVQQQNVFSQPRFGDNTQTTDSSNKKTLGRFR